MDHVLVGPPLSMIRNALTFSSEGSLLVSNSVLVIQFTHLGDRVAFVLLLLPFCITHLFMYAGYSVPSASSVFADVCVSMLGMSYQV